MRRRTKIRTATTVGLGLAIVYLLIAYFVMPEIWVFRDASRVSDFGSMLTHTEQDIPGDPINIGLSEQKKRSFAHSWQPTGTLPTPSRSVLPSISVSASCPPTSIWMRLSALCFLREGSKTRFRKTGRKQRDQRNHVRFWLTKKLGSDSRPALAGFGQFLIAASDLAMTPAKSPTHRP